jgi:hypothetical protein
MEETLNMPHTRMQSFFQAARWFIPPLVLLVLLGAYLYWRMLSPASAAFTPAVEIPRSQAIEDEFGVRFTFLAVTAKGGFIDIRYRVLDADKAVVFGHYTETTPYLIVEDTGEVVDSTIMSFHNHRIEPSRIYYALFRNRSNAIQPGDMVTIAVGDLTLEHVPVQ